MLLPPLHCRSWMRILRLLALLVSLRGIVSSSSCEQLVFSGLGNDCNLNAAGTVALCCARLAAINTPALCFCDAGVMSGLVAAVGEAGVSFFSSFASRSCGFDMIRGDGCPAQPSPASRAPPNAPQTLLPPRAPQVAAPSPPPLFRVPPPPAAPTLMRTLGSLVCDRSDLLGVMCDALIASGLLNVLQGPGPYTLFVPSNLAWYAALSKLGSTKEELFADPALTEVLAHHLTRGILPKSSFQYGQHIQTLQRSAPSVAREARIAAAGGVSASRAYEALTSDLTVEVHQNALFKNVYVAGCQIVLPDLRAANGVLHVVDCVLLPPPPQALPTTRSVGAIIRERFELSVYEQALQGTGLLTALDAASPESPVTVFAPSNAAFIRYAASSPAFWITDASGRAVNPGVPGLPDVLKYGLVRGRQTAASLSALGSPLISVQGSPLFTDFYRGVYFNYLYVNGCRARVTDIVATNGIVHILECVPTPPSV